MLKKDEFLKKYRIDGQILIEQNIDWDVLKGIYNDFIKIKKSLETQAAFISDVLRGHSKVHTVRSRVKDPEHLVAKLIRKTQERKEVRDKDFQFSIENYKDEITDLIGVRAIHIFKEDWQDIHKFITTTWNVIEVKANVREGDSTEPFDKLGVEIDKRKTGYRSVHYLIEFSPTNQKVIAEIQVRTIFEEGYGEIDHHLRYPHNDVPEVLELNLLMLNRVAGSSDEMASFINHLKNTWQEMIGNYEKQIKDLEQVVEKSNMEKQDKQTALSEIEGIKKNFNDDLLKTSVNLSSFRSADMSALTRALASPISNNISSALGALSGNLSNALITQNAGSLTNALSGLDTSALTKAMQTANVSSLSNALSGLDTSVLTKAMQTANVSSLSNALSGLDKSALKKAVNTTNEKSVLGQSTILGHSSVTKNPKETETEDTKTETDDKPEEE